MEVLWVQILGKPRLLQSCESAFIGWDMLRMSGNGAAPVKCVSKGSPQLHETEHRLLACTQLSNAESRVTGWETPTYYSGG